MLYFISLAVIFCFAFDIIQKEDLEKHKVVIFNTAYVFSLGLILYYVEGLYLFIYYSITILFCYIFYLLYNNPSVKKIYSFIPLLVITIYSFLLSTYNIDKLRINNPFVTYDIKSELLKYNYTIDSLNRIQDSIELSINKKNKQLDSINATIDIKEYEESYDFLHNILNIK